MWCSYPIQTYQPFYPLKRPISGLTCPPYCFRVFLAVLHEGLELFSDLNFEQQHARVSYILPCVALVLACLLAIGFVLAVEYVRGEEKIGLRGYEEVRTRAPVSNAVTAETGLAVRADVFFRKRCRRE